MSNKSKKSSGFMQRMAIVVYMLLGCFAFLWLVAPLTATAAPRLAETINVTTTTDELNGGNGVCSLREAIEVANTGNGASYPECVLTGLADGSYIISLPAGTYTLTIAGAGEDANATGDLDISASVSIVGAGTATTIVQAGTAPDNGIDRVFHVEGGATVNISGVTVQNGSVTTTGATDGGGGIFNEGLLDISDAIITSNSVTGSMASGGGILNTGTLSMTNSTISNNSSLRAGGGIETTDGATVTLSNVDLLNNTTGIAGAANPGNGGGLHMSGNGDVTVNGGSVTGNFAALEGGGLWNGPGTMTIDSTNISNNAAAGNGADEGGGGLFNAGGTMTVTNAIIDNNLASGGTAFELSGSQEVPMVSTSAMGDAIFQYNAVAGTFQLDLFVTGIELTDMTADPQLTGAHIHQQAAGANGGVIVNLLALGSFEEVPGGIRLVLENQAFPAANAVDLLAGNTYINIHSSANAGGEIRGQITIPATMGSGGGILNDQGTLTIDNSTIQNNIASRAGGGIESNIGTTTLTSVILSNNIAGPDGAATPGNGGGLHVTGAGTVNINGGTVQNNTAAEEGGGLWNATGMMTIDGTTISDNVANAGNNGGNDQGGGGVFNIGGIVDIDNATITSNMATVNLGNGGGVMTVGGTVTINDSTIAVNNAARAGGGIENNVGTVTLTNVTLGGAIAADGNSAGVNGGGLHVSGAGTTNVNGGTVQNNTAAEEGGGLWNGTGIMTISDTSDNVLIDSNTASGNGADQGGGGIFNAGGTVLIQDNDITNSVTISNNTADGTSGSGDGIFNDTGGTSSFDTNNVDISLSDTLGGAGEITKGGPGTLTLAGANTYTGNTTVMAGTLLVNNTMGTGTGTGNVIVQSGATLGGNGTISGEVTAASGGFVAPGLSPGILSTGNLTLNTGATLTIEINGTTAGTDFDQVVVTGAVDITDAVLTGTLGFTPTTGDDFIIINNDGADAVTGTFNGLAEGSMITIGDYEFTITYLGMDGSTGNDVVLLDATPLAVTLALFETEADTDSILIRWQTVSERDNLGFNLYRATEIDGEQSQLNSELISAQAPGSGQGAAYEWLDTTVEAASTYFYWLEDVDVDGNTTMHGPISASANETTAVTTAQLSTQSRSEVPALALLMLTLLTGGWLLRRQRQR